MKNKKILFTKYDDKTKKFLKSKDANFVNKIIENQKNVFDIKNHKNMKINFKTLYKNGVATNYNEITITISYKRQSKNKKYKYNYYINLLEKETYEKDFYKFINIYSY